MVLCHQDTALSAYHSSASRERVAQAVRAKPVHTSCPNQATPSCPDRQGTPGCPELSNWIKVNEFAGLLNVFYIQGSTKINVKMTSQTITDEFIYISVQGNEKNT
jgi:hypothetical protein